MFCALEEGFDPPRVVAEHRDLFQIAGVFGVCAETTAACAIRDEP
jgi:hypothetical protein